MFLGSFDSTVVRNGSGGLSCPWTSFLGSFLICFSSRLRICIGFFLCMYACMYVMKRV